MFKSVRNANQATWNRACHYTPRQSQGAPARASGSRGSRSDSRRSTDDWTASLWCARVRPSSGRSSSSKPGSCAARRRRLSSASTRKRPVMLCSPQNKVQNPVFQNLHCGGQREPHDKERTSTACSCSAFLLWMYACITTHR